MSEQKKKWSKKGYEVHVSKDGKDDNWCRHIGSGHKRPSYSESELPAAKKAFKAAQRENKFTRLIRLEMNYELIEVSKTTETEQERKDKILLAAQSLFKDDPTVECRECSFMNMSSLEMTPTQVRIEIKNSLLGVGACPMRRDFPKGPEGKEPFERAGSEWKAKVTPLHDAKASEVADKLKAAGMKYRSGRDYGWMVFVLA